MGMIQLPDEWQGLIEREVADSHAAAFVEEAVIRLIEDIRAYPIRCSRTKIAAQNRVQSPPACHRR